MSSVPRERLLAFVGYGSILGAWSSASLLILDWDRPWQAWPYPCLMGTLGGAVIGLLLSMFYPLIRRVWSNSQCPAWCPPMSQYAINEAHFKVRVN
ncbi:unnamed protein product [Echinostoma caproni]|uniref:Phosphatidylinositol-glycan biosynthesis class F protein n=1 Tax=Echinostoma caproni TaxID=27848 RepID=A0A183B145_9TREM|nr:unnamed protein product [Echinostoma caproni]